MLNFMETPTAILNCFTNRSTYTVYVEIMGSQFLAITTKSEPGDSGLQYNLPFSSQY